MRVPERWFGRAPTTSFEAVRAEWGEAMWTHREDFRIAVVDHVLRRVGAGLPATMRPNDLLPPVQIVRTI